MAKNYRKINHEMLTLARDSRGISQPELAKKMGVNQGWISRVEGGLRTIQPEQLEKLAEILHYPIGFFTQKDTIYGLGINAYFHRKKQNVSSKSIKAIHASIYIRTLHIAKLLRSVDIEGVNNIIPFNIDDFDGDAEEIARLVRINWKMKSGPVHNVVAEIENAGGIVIPFDFGKNEIDAVYHCTPDTPPLFYINRFSPTDRLRMTLSHELGHAILHSDNIDPELIEKQAYQFAAEFLMPKRDIYEYLRNLTMEKLMVLKQYWKVSMAALLKRAGDIGAITPTRSQQLWKQMSKFGFRKSEPAELNLPFEAPTTLEEIVSVYLDDMDYTLKDFSNLLFLYQDEVESIYIGAKNKYKDKERDDAIKEAERILKGEK